jgi:hypothetical protein
MKKDVWDNVHTFTHAPQAVSDLSDSAIQRFFNAQQDSVFELKRTKLFLENMHFTSINHVEFINCNSAVMDGRF